MGVVDELLHARAEFERGDWRAAYDGWATFDLSGLSPDDLERSAAAAQLLGRVDEAVERYTAAYEAGLVPSPLEPADLNPLPHPFP